MQEILSPLKIAFSFIGAYWWIFTPVILVAGTVTGWLVYITQKYLLSLNWVVLELKPPPDVQKSPKIAENIFSALHSSYSSPIKWKKRFFKGEVPNFYSLEIVGNGGQISFLMRVTEASRPYVEQAVFSQYPDAEIREVPDYIASVPQNVPDDDYDLFGTDLIFANPDAYPLRTYPYFEEESGKDEFKRTDPLAPLAEAMSSLQPGEHIWVQYLIRPTGSAWVKDAQSVIDKIVGKKAAPKTDALHTLLQKAIDVTDENIFLGAHVEEKKEEKKEISLLHLTPGQRYALEQVENKIAKLGFKTNIRFIYLARKELFNRARVGAVLGTFKQFYANNLNSLKPNSSTITKADGFLHHLFPSDKGFFWAQQEYKRKRKLFLNLARRKFLKKVNIYNTEELATLFHLPGIGLRAPAFPRVEAKKGQPPAGLPM